MNLCTIKYIPVSHVGLCGDAFKGKDLTTQINLDFILSLSDIQKFHLPLSSKEVDCFAVVTMSNNDKYHIRKSEYNLLKMTISIIKYGNYIP